MLEIADRWVWDSWFVDVGDAYHVFFLQAPRALGDPDLRHVNASVGHAVSTDLRTWTRLPDALAPGEPGSFDGRATWTGCVVEHGDGWAMYYTGLSTAGEQRIGLARSDDLISWHKHADNPILESDTRWYEPTAGDGVSQPAWRDPWVYRGDDGHHMLITARVDHGPSRTRGVVARARSDDLLRWEVESPLTTPSDFAELEVPQLIDVMGRDVLIFSCGPEGLSPRRLAEPAGGGTYALVIADVPTSSADAVALDLPGLYACRVVRDRGGEPCVVGFVNREATGAFGGTLSDPVSLQAAAPELFVNSTH
jgi:beta-fructofuranosidase